MNINKYIPTYVIDSIFKMDPKDVLKRQYKVILSDLDNTLDCYLNECPSDEVKNNRHYSATQHRRNVGEGQLCLKNLNIYDFI